MIADHLGNVEQFGSDLWKLADDLRANSGLASNEYFMPIMGLLFLRQATNRYYAALAEIEADQAAGNPMRMDYQIQYETIIADYNREKNRTTIEETFRRLLELVKSLDEEEQRAAREGLGEDELALFDLLLKDDLDKASRERVKQAMRLVPVSSKRSSPFSPKPSVVIQVRGFSSPRGK